MKISIFPLHAHFVTAKISIYHIISPWNPLSKLSLSLSVSFKMMIFFSKIKALLYIDPQCFCESLIEECSPLCTHKRFVYISEFFDIRLCNYFEIRNYLESASHQPLQQHHNDDQINDQTSLRTQHMPCYCCYYCFCCCCLFFMGSHCASSLAMGSCQKLFRGGAYGNKMCKCENCKIQINICTYVQKDQIQQQLTITGNVNLLHSFIMGIRVYQTVVISFIIFLCANPIKYGN